MIKNLEEAAKKWVFETNGMKWSNNDNTAGDNYGSFKAGAEWMQSQYHSTWAELATILEDCNKHRKTVYTKDQMIMFAGFCMGRRMLDPIEDVTVILEDFEEQFKINQDGK
jgi:hypothetical protein